MSDVLIDKIDDYFASDFQKISSFSQYIEDVSVLINQACKDSCDKLLKCVSTSAIENLYSPYASFVQNAGKRTRPSLALIGASLFDYRPSAALSSGLAIEHFHSAALIHDDIADSSLLRRDEQCLHLKIGDGLAINCGDFGLNYMTSVILSDDSTPPSVKVSLLKSVNRMAAHTIEGQALDIGWAKDATYNLGVEDYIYMATNKTAYYSVATPLVCGAIVAGANAEQIEVLEQFGIGVGLAFQIQDDIINLTENSNVTGKGCCDDIVEGKRTLIVIHALNNAKPADRVRLIDILSNSDNSKSDIDDALDIIDSTKSIEYASDYASKLIADAKLCLCDNIKSSHTLDICISMAKWVLTRKR